MTRRAHQLLAVLLVLATVATPLVGAVAAADDTRPAELAIRQESYVDGDVSRQQQNGTPVYSAAGERIWIKPQNFDPANVVDFGVDRAAGELGYDQELGAYTFSSEGEEASFTLYWIVLEQQQVAAANNTTTTKVQRVRYEATVRITDQVDLDHVPAGQLDRLREDADQWQSFNGTLQDIRESDLLLWAFRKDPPDTETLLQGMINTYITTRDPLRLLTGGLMAVILTLTLTVGGLLFLAIREGIAAIAARRMRTRLNQARANEPYEGELSDRVLEADREERDQIWSNQDFQDFGWSDHEAAAYRELGKTPREAFERIVTDVIPPKLQIRERLQAMSQLGYVALVRERDDDGAVVDAEVVLEDEIEGEDPEIVELDDPDEDLVEALWNDRAMLEFDPVEADIDLGDFETEPVTLSVDEALAELGLQVDRFEDEKDAMRLLHEHIEAAASSDYTDDVGTPKTSMRVLQSWLETSTWLRDVHGFPSARKLADHLEAAIKRFDPGREAEEYAEDVRSGKDA